MNVAETLAPIRRSGGYADRIRILPRSERLALYRLLPPGALASQRYKGLFWAGGKQIDLLLADRLAPMEIITGGRRRGKTWTAVQLYLRELLSGRLRDLFPRIIAATDDDARDTVLLGRSGLLTWCPPEHLPRAGRKLPQKVQSVYFPTVGTEVHVITAESPGQAIGQGSGFTLADDPAKWIDQCGEMKAREMLKQARISNSEGAAPCMLIPSTPRSNAFMRTALTPGQLRGARVTNIGDTSENTSLSREYVAGLDDLRAEDPAEFDGILRHETPGALWRRAWIVAGYVTRAPALRRVVVAVDPADDGKMDSDETGIVVVGIGEDERLYVLADYTARHDAEAWPAIAAWAFREHRADAIAAEMNRARSLVRRCLAIEAPHVPIVEVDATRGKATRAEPCALQTRDGLVCFVVGGPQLTKPGAVEVVALFFDPKRDRREPRPFTVKRDRRGWETLEDELCGWDPRRRRSPNGLDALVWGAWHLKPPEVVQPPRDEDIWATGLGSRYDDGDMDRGYDDGR